MNKYICQEKQNIVLEGGRVDIAEECSGLKGAMST